MVSLTGYKLTFDDEFNTLNAGVTGTKGITWETENFYGDLSTGNSGTVNPTPPGQSGSQFSISNGVLSMAITPNSSPYLDTNPAGVPGGFSQEYGYFEMRAEFVGVSGYQDAFWLLPNGGPWPPEIDIEESYGANHNEVNFTNHGGDINTPVNNYNIYNGPDFTTGFHTYGLMWTPTTLTWYLDGNEIYSCPTASNENQPMNVILSAYADMGQGWTPDVQAGTSDSFKVDYVHVYSNNGANPEIAGQAGYQDHDGSTSLTPAAPPPVTSPPATNAVTVGSGPDSFVLKISEDAYANHDSISDAAGDARFEVFVDGKQQGGVFNAAASHKAGADQTYTIKGTFGAGAHTVAVQFLNDAWAPSQPDANGSFDRNLYVDGVSYDGTDAHQSAALMRDVTTSFAIPASATPTTMSVCDDTGASASVPIITSGTSSFKGSLDTTVTQSVANGTDTVSFDAHISSETVMLGSGTQSFIFHSPVALILTGGSGTDTVKADSGPGRNLFTAGTGSLDVTGGSSGSTYFFHANGGAMKIEDFDFNKGDSLGVDKALQGAFKCASDGHGGSVLTFGTAGSIDLVGHAAITASNIGWV